MPPGFGRSSAENQSASGIKNPTTLNSPATRERQPLINYAYANKHL